MALQESLNRLAKAMTTLSDKQDLTLSGVQSNSSKLKHLEHEIDQIEARVKVLSIQEEAISAQLSDLGKVAQEILDILNHQFSSVAVIFRDSLGDEIPVDFLTLNAHEGQVIYGSVSAQDALGSVISLNPANTQWMTSDPTKLQVNQNGTDVVLNPIAAGTALLIVSITPNGGNTINFSTTVEITSLRAVSFSIDLAKA